MTKKENFLELVSGTDTKVVEQITWRIENREWLKHSQAVAIRVLSTLAERGMSQKDLARKIGVSPQLVNKWVRGKENFTFETISKLEAALEIELIYTSCRKKNADKFFQNKKDASRDAENFKIAFRLV